MVSFTLYPLYCQYFLNTRLSGPQGQLGCSGKQEHLYCCPSRIPAIQIMASHSAWPSSLILPHYCTYDMHGLICLSEDK